jgi:amino-acid N-acetyltransferase
MSTTITASHGSDFAEVLALLRAVNLPVEGVLEHFRDFLVAREADGRLAGCVGQERHGKVALLRSLAVSPAHQGQGLGRELVLEAIAAARHHGVTELVLLTTTAAAFFERHFGFALVDRAHYDAAFTDSPEWKLPRCSSAACLVLQLA